MALRQGVVTLTLPGLPGIEAASPMNPMKGVFFNLGGG